MSEARAVDVLGRALAALKKAGADDGRARLSGGAGRNMRFARNGITTNGSVRSMTLTLYASVGKRTASIAGNRIDDESLTEMAAEVVANARVLPENTEHMPSLAAQSYEKVNAWFAETADIAPAELAATAGEVTAAARAKDVNGGWLRNIGKLAPGGGHLERCVRTPSVLAGKIDRNHTHARWHRERVGYKFCPPSRGF